MQEPEVRKAKVRTFHAELASLPLFRDAEACLKSVAEEYVYEAQYAFGQPVIIDEGRPEKALVWVNEHPLEPNPLFIVLSGFAEIHRPIEGVSPEGEPVPWMMVKRGDFFGEFEIGAIDATLDSGSNWNRYVAQVTAGIVTAHVSSMGFGRYSVQQALCGGDELKSAQLCQSPVVTAVLRKTIASVDGKFKLKLLVVPRRVVSELCKDELFLAQYHNAFVRHFQRYQLLNPVSSKERLRNPEQMLEHFATDLIPALARGDLPFLASCTEYPELASWWRWYHQKIKEELGLKGGRKVGVPHYLFVPVTRGVGSASAGDGTASRQLSPVLSWSMIQGLMRGRGVPTRPDKSYISKINKCAMKAKVQWQLRKLSHQWLEGRRSTDWNELFVVGSQSLEGKRNYQLPKPLGVPGGKLFYLEESPKDASE